MEGSEDECIDEIAFSKEVLEFLRKERKKLKEAGLDADCMIEQLEKLLQETEDSKAHLEDLKRQMLMETSRSLIGEKGPPPASTERLDMAAKELRKEGDLEDYYKRLRRRSTTPEARLNDT